MHAAEPPEPALAAAFEGLGLRLHERLGSGSSGVVHRAELLRPAFELSAGSDVAVKILQPAADPEAAQHTARAAAQLQREAELGRRVRDPHVARIHGSGVAEVAGCPPLTFLVMQLVRGSTLRRFLLDSGPPVEDLSRRIGLDAARGLAALHALGVVHRDIKPDNLVLTPAGEVVIVDLGLARRSGARGSHSSGGFFGSLAYAAPEVLSGRRSSAGSDLYSLGLVLFEMVTGQHPFAAATATADEMLHAHLHQPPPRASYLEPRVSALLESLVDDLLQKDPAARPGRAADVATILAAGEASRYWRHRQAETPVLVSRQQLRGLRRASPTPLFGRHDEHRQMDRLLRRATAGRGQAVLWTGARGIGRRRLLDSCLEAWLRARNDLVLLGGEPPRDTASPHGEPFAQMLRAWYLAGDASPDTPRLGARLAARIRAETQLAPAEARRLARLLSGEEVGDSAAGRADLLTSGLLDICRGDRVLVLRIDRANTLSPTGELVLQRLLGARDQHRLLLMLVAPAGHAVPGLARHTSTLGGLSAADFLALGLALFADDEPRVRLEATLRAAHATLGGSPGNLIDALEDLVQRGLLRGRPGQYLGLAADELAPARPALERLQQRVASLPPHRSFVFKATAVLGESCPLEDLVALSGQTELEVLEALSLLDDVVEAARRRAEFLHRDYRAALLAMIPWGTRRRLHRAAAWLLEERGAPPLEVGLHLSDAGEHEAAVPPLAAAVEELARAGSPQATSDTAGRLLAHLDALPGDPVRQPLRLRATLLDAEALRRAGQPDRAQQRFEVAFRLARAADDAASQAHALVGLAEVARPAGRLLAALDLAARAEQAAGASEPALAARALHLRAQLLGDLGHADDAESAVRDALRRLPQDDTRQRPWLRLELARLHALRGAFARALDELDRAAARLGTAPTPRGLLRVRLARGTVLAQVGDHAAALAELELALQTAAQLGDGGSQARALLAMGHARADAGAPERARGHFADALAAASVATDRPTRAAAGLALAWHRVPCDGIASDVEAVDMPALRAEWLLLRALRGQAELLGEVREIDLAITLPVDLRLRLLDAGGDAPAADRLVERVSLDLPAGTARRLFRARARRLRAAAVAFGDAR